MFKIGTRKERQGGRIEGRVQEREGCIRTLLLMFDNYPSVHDIVEGTGLNDEFVSKIYELKTNYPEYTAEQIAYLTIEYDAYSKAG